MNILVGLAVVLVAGFVPMIVYSAIMWWIDRYEKEPWWLLVLTFLWGAVPAVIIAIVFQLITGVTFSVAHWSEASIELTMSSVIAPLTEEPAKGVAVLLVFMIFRREMDSLLDGVIYGSLVGFGFAATENVLYFLGALVQGGIGAVLVLALLRAFLFGLNHAFFTALFGIGLAYARHGKSLASRFLMPVAGLALAITFHGLHNLGAVLVNKHLAWLGFSTAIDWLGIIGVVLLIVVMLNVEKRWLVLELREEVAAGDLSYAEFREVVSSTRRSSQLLVTLFRHGPVACWNLHRFYQAATKLAFQKRHLRELGDDPDAYRRIDDLRDQIADLRRRMPGRGFA